MSLALGKPLKLARQAGEWVGFSLLDLVLPPACRLCNLPVSSGDFCSDCVSALTLSETVMESACPRCGIPRPRVTGHRATSDRATSDRATANGATANGATADWWPADQGTDANCLHCRDKGFDFDAVVAMWSYQDRVCEAVIAAKYAHQSPLADALGRRLSRRVADRFSQPNEQGGPELVTYVPSHVTRQFARGGNGNRTIAMAVSRKIGLPCHTLLKMTRRIAKQAWLDDPQRLKNVHDAFTLKKSYAFPRPPAIANRHILLVDDVLTTGSTANEIAAVLHRGGARRVTLAVVARALRSQ